MVVFRHLMATPHRRALLGQLDKMFDERVLLGTGISSKEMLRFVARFRQRLCSHLSTMML